MFELMKRKNKTNPRDNTLCTTEDTQIKTQQFVFDVQYIANDSKEKFFSRTIKTIGTATNEKNSHNAKLGEIIY